MAYIHIKDLSDRRLDAYRNVRDPILRRDSGKFMAESKQIVLRMFAAGLKAESVLTDEKRAEEMAAVVPEGVPHYVISEEMMREMAGFAIHTGTLAIGYRPAEVLLEEVMEEIAKSQAAPGSGSGRPLILICEKLKEPVNAGSMVRVAAAMGVSVLVLGPECCDPFYRRAIRVSMGTVFKQPIVRSRDLVADVWMLRRRYGVHCAATVLAEDAVRLPEFGVKKPEALKRGTPIALLMGHEVEGLSEQLVRACDSKVTLPMARETDSLNVAVSAAVFAYHARHVMG